MTHRLTRMLLRHASRLVNRWRHGITYYLDPPDCEDCPDCCDYQHGYSTFCPTHEGSPLMLVDDDLRLLGVTSIDELWEPWET